VEEFDDEFRNFLEDESREEYEVYKKWIGNIMSIFAFYWKKKVKLAITKSLSDCNSSSDDDDQEYAATVSGDIDQGSRLQCSNGKRSIQPEHSKDSTDRGTQGRDIIRIESWPPKAARDPSRGDST
jgi:hypothetical protein